MDWSEIRYKNKKSVKKVTQNFEHNMSPLPLRRSKQKEENIKVFLFKQKVYLEFDILFWHLDLPTCLLTRTFKMQETRVNI